MTFFKSLKPIMLLVNIVYIIVGYLLIVKGSACVEMVVTVLGYVLMACGIVEIIRYFITKIDQRYKRNDFILGIVLMALAIVVIICRYSLSDVTTVALGIAIIVSGALKIQDAMDEKRLGGHNFVAYLILMLVCFGFGALVIFNYFYSFSVNILYSSAGIGLLFAGLSDLISNIYLAILKVKYEKGKDEDINDKQDSEAKFTTIDVDNTSEVIDVTPDEVIADSALSKQDDESVLTDNNLPEENDNKDN